MGDQYGEVLCCVTNVQRTREFVIARDWAGYTIGLKGAKAIALALTTSNLEKLHLESAFSCMHSKLCAFMTFVGLVDNSKRMPSTC